MSIASEITRIQGAKADLKTAIEGKGVTVPSSTKLDGYADLVDDIQTGGGDPNLQDKTVSYTPTESQQTATVTADSGYDGLSEVDVTVGAIDSDYVGSGVPRRSSSDLVASGRTVAVPAGFYQYPANKSIDYGVIENPIATKGAVSNNTIEVTPSVEISTAGYFKKQTNAGTAVSVSASELVSGTKSISANGTEDVTNYASVSVSVPNSYSASDEGKVVDNGALVSQTSDTVTANDTYDTTLINSLTVNVSGGSSIDFSSIKQNFSLTNIGSLFTAFENGKWDSLEYSCVSGTNPITVNFGRSIKGLLIYPKSLETDSVAGEAADMSFSFWNDPDEDGIQSRHWGILRAKTTTTTSGTASTNLLSRLSSFTLQNGVLSMVPQYPTNAAYHPFRFNIPYIFLYWWE